MIKPVSLSTSINKDMIVFNNKKLSNGCYISKKEILGRQTARRLASQRRDDIIGWKTTKTCQSLRIAWDWHRATHIVQFPNNKKITAAELNNIPTFLWKCTYSNWFIVIWTVTAGLSVGPPPLLNSSYHKHTHLTFLAARWLRTSAWRRADGLLHHQCKSRMILWPGRQTIVIEWHHRRGFDPENTYFTASSFTHSHIWVIAWCLIIITGELHVWVKRLLVLFSHHICLLIGEGSLCCQC